MLIDKNPPVKDRKYLDYLKTKTCILSGYPGSDYDAIDPMHVGTYGKGMKSDDEAMPALHSLHHIGHQKGEITMIRNTAPDWLIREAFRAYNREQYRIWREDNG